MSKKTCDLNSDSEMDVSIKELKARLLFRKSNNEVTKEKPFKCNFCYLIFSKSSDLDSHKLTHFIRKSYKCEVCCLEFNYAFLLKEHKRMHKDSNIFNCNICDDAFSNETEFIKHKLIHEVNEPIPQIEEINENMAISDSISDSKVGIPTNKNDNEKPIKCSLVDESSTQKIFNKNELVYTENLIEPVILKVDKEITEPIPQIEENIEYEDMVISDGISNLKVQTNNNKKQIVDETSAQQILNVYEQPTPQIEENIECDDTSTQPIWNVHEHPLPQIEENIEYNKISDGISDSEEYIQTNYNENPIECPLVNETSTQQIWNEQPIPHIEENIQYGVMEMPNINNSSLFAEIATQPILISHERPIFQILQNIKLDEMVIFDGMSVSNIHVPTNFNEKPIDCSLVDEPIPHIEENIEYDDMEMSGEISDSNEYILTNDNENPIECPLVDETSTQQIYNEQQIEENIEYDDNEMSGETSDSEVYVSTNNIENPIECPLVNDSTQQILNSFNPIFQVLQPIKYDGMVIFDAISNSNVHIPTNNNEIPMECSLFENSTQPIFNSFKHPIFQIQEPIKYDMVIADGISNSKVYIPINNNGQPIECSLVDETSAQHVLNDHKLVYAENSEEPIVSKIEAEIKESKELTITKFTCVECGMKFDTGSNLIEHQLTHNVEKETKSDLANNHKIINKSKHVSKEVNLDKKFQVNQLCEKLEEIKTHQTEMDFETKSNLIQLHHYVKKTIKPKHEVITVVKEIIIRKIECEYCNKKFSYTKDLIKHELDCSSKNTIKNDLSKDHRTYNGSEENLTTEYNFDQSDKQFSHMENRFEHKKDHISNKSVKPNSSKDHKEKEITKSDLPNNHKHSTKKYECDRCDKKYYYRADLHEHQKKHSTNKSASKSVKHISPKDHKEKETTKPDLPNDLSTKKYACDRCDKKYYNRSDLYEHKKKHSTNKSVKHNSPKDHKEKEITKPDLPNEHKHLTKKYECDRCDKKYYNRSDLQEHQKTHSTNKSVKHNSHSKDHKETTKPDLPNDHKHSTKKYECDRCDKKYYNRSDLHEHQKTHSTNKSVKHNSPKDHKEKETIKPDLPIDHKKNNKTKEYTCGQCNKLFSNIIDLLEHERMHSSNKLVKPILPKDHKEKNITKPDLPIDHKKFNKEKGKSNTYKCDQCDKKFLHRENLIEHKKNHSTNKSAKPILPNDHKEKNKTKSVLPIDHKKNNKEKQKSNEYNCDQCDKKFLHRENLIEHLKSHKSIKSISPTDHKMKEITKFDLPIKHEQITNAFKCKQCDIQFSNRLKLKEHLTNHSSKKYKCQCDQIFFTSLSLKVHRRDKCSKRTILENGEIPNLYKCEECCEQFSRKYTLECHMMKNHPKIMIRPKKIEIVTEPEVTHNNFKCFICYLPFKGETDLLEHNKITHPVKETIPMETNCENKSEQTKKAQFQCDICEHTYILKSTLRKHMITHSGTRPFKCDMCREAFATEWFLSRHKASHDVVKKSPPKFKCNVCDKVFTRNSNLKVHERTHTGAKPFKCNLCPLRFARSTHLTEHILRHKGETPYQCEICDKAFARSGILREHELIHSEEASFKCNICNRAFFRFSALRDHKVIHTADSQFFICELCGMRFLWNSNLTKHITKWHSKKPNSQRTGNAVDLETIFECDVCDMTYFTESELHTHNKTHVDFDKRTPIITRSKRIVVLEDVLILPSEDQNNASAEAEVNIINK